ncbi:HesB/YadR/YfhF family protein [Neobacillus drentensis]|uniref:HesB/YadR/YfhF family protein n=1 Tax=Neobacillus drentensis TaxID=220684 RepID=UPI00300077E6
MFVSIDKSAVAWFTKEFEFNKPFSIRMFPQYDGFGKMHKGYSLGFSIETPANIGYTHEVDGINFFVEANDVWFFEDTETNLTVDVCLEEIMVTYKDLTGSAVS